MHSKVWIEARVCLRHRLHTDLLESRRNEAQRSSTPIIKRWCLSEQHEIARPLVIHNRQEGEVVTSLTPGETAILVVGWIMCIVGKIIVWMEADGTREVPV